MARYKQVFTLRDIFTNKELKNVLPIVSYKEVMTEEGETKIRSNVKTIKSQAFNTANRTAKPFYEDFKGVRTGNTLVFEGKLKGDANECQNAVYEALKAIKPQLEFSANNMNMIREAIKETERRRMRTGIDTKLYLRVSSIQEIKNMSPKELKYFMEDVMENIYYGDYTETQGKYKVEERDDFGKSYDERSEEWEEKINRPR